MKAPSLESERLFLKPVSLEHLSQDYVDWMNDKEVNRYLESGGDYSLEKLEEFLVSIERQELLFWGIHLKSTSQHIGNIKIDPINPKHGLAEYGIMMGRKSEWGRGYATEATKRVVGFCFANLALRKITLGVIKDNVAALRLYQKMGFELEGTYRKHVKCEGTYCDVVRMALFNPDFTYVNE